MLIIAILQKTSTLAISNIPIILIEVFLIPMEVIALIIHVILIKVIVILIEVLLTHQSRLVPSTAAGPCAGLGKAAKPEIHR